MTRFFNLLIAALFIFSLNQVNAQVQLEVAPYAGSWDIVDESGEFLFGSDFMITKSIGRKWGIKGGIGVGQVNLLKIPGARYGLNFLDFYAGVVYHSNEGQSGFFSDLMINPGRVREKIKVEGGGSVSLDALQIGGELGFGYKFQVNENLNIGFRSALNIYSIEGGDPGIKVKNAVTIGYRF